MDRPREYYAKWKKSEKNKYHMISLIRGILKKKKKPKPKPTDKQKKTKAHKHREQISGYQRGETGWRSKIVVGGFEVQSTMYKINNLQWCTV